MTYDAVVIGAGHNGLAAAVELQSKGWSVAVVEGKPVAGGAVKTREVTLPGFRHEWRFWDAAIQEALRFFGLDENGGNPF